MIRNFILSLRKNLVISEFFKKRIYLTDLERNITFVGIVEIYNEIKGHIKVSLRDVKVFEYSSAMPLYDLPEITFSRPKNKIFVELTH